MKKISILIIICLIIFLLTGCAYKTVIENGHEVTYINGFKAIAIFNDSSGCPTIRIVCDPDTKVMYYMVGSTESDAFALTPYYIVKNGKAEIAVYNRNYFD